MPFIEETITVRDGLRLYLRRHEVAEARGEVIIVHGFGDHSGRYGALTEHLLANGYSVTAYDQRGHGLSDGLAGHVEEFSEYEDDLDRIVAATRSRAGGRPLFIIGHSMGGLVTLRYLAKKKWHGGGRGHLCAAHRRSDSGAGNQAPVCPHRPEMGSPPASE